MSDSNAQWGQLAEHDPEAADLWDSFQRLPESGENAVLDSFCKRKNITINGLLKFGVRLVPDSDTLVFGYDYGLKYRSMTTGDKWGRLGSDFLRGMKIIRHGVEPTDQIVVVEGETDAVRVAEHYPVDVAVQPAGARAVPPAYIDQLSEYRQILVGLDADEAGQAGLAKWRTGLGLRVTEFRPEGDQDWCASSDDHLPLLPDELPEPEPELPVLVSAGQMLDLEVPAVPSWFSDDVVPVGGLVIAHAWAKSFKSFMSFDMLASIAQCEPWCGFTPLEEPAKVAVVQFEIKWAYYQKRIQHLRSVATNKELFDSNFMTWTPLTRPKLRAGDVKNEDYFLRTLSDAGVQVVLFDPVRRMAGEADLNAENEVRKMLAFFERLNDYGITVIATHHDNKDGARSGGGSAVNMTGSGGFAGDPDTLVSVELPKGEDYDASTRRNIRFTLRNSPIISPRAMEITSDGTMRYYDQPWDYSESTAATASSIPADEADNEPAI